MSVLSVTVPAVVQDMERIASEAKVFVSMPYISGITPNLLLKRGIGERPSGNGVERFRGIFKINEVGLSAFDHGVLYGDAVFEGVLVVCGRLFQWREHLDRLYASAARLGIHVPYTSSELTEHILETVKSTSVSQNQPSYIRLVVTRGVGDLGIHPAKCVGSTIYSIVSTIQLYPESVYERGIHVSLSKMTRRPGPEILDPQIKSCNYLNNVMALLETLPEGCKETVMLTSEGFVAEATTENLFLAVREDGWENDPARVTLFTPSSNYCLKGITRGLVLGYARHLGFKVVESTTLLPKDFAGSYREVFLTGTAAGLVPVIAVDGHEIGNGVPGPVTSSLRELLSADMQRSEMGLALIAHRREINEYLANSGPVSSESALEDISKPTNLITRLFEAVDSCNWEILAQLFCHDAVYERPGYGPLVGLERVIKFYREERVIASGKHHLENIVLTENSGASWGRFVGVHRNGTPLDERFADVYRFKDGKIWNRQSYFFRPAV